MGVKDKTSATLEGPIAIWLNAAPVREIRPGVGLQQVEIMGTIIVKRTLWCQDCETTEKLDYMVEEEVWPVVHSTVLGVPSKKLTGMLCLDCLSKRIERPVVEKDLTDCLLNVRQRIAFNADK